MLTPEQMEKYQIQANSLYSEVQKQLIERIIKGLEKSSRITDETEYLIFKALEMKVASEDIRKIIAKILKKSEKEIDDIFNEATETSYNYDIGTAKFDEINLLPYKENSEVLEIRDKVARETKDRIYDMFLLLGFVMLVNNRVKPVEINAYYNIVLDSVYNGIKQGKTYDEVLKPIVNEMTSSGVRTIPREELNRVGGTSSRIDVATRREIMTGLKDMQEQVSEIDARSIGTTVYEISWHTGHRPSHGWGGQRYDRQGKLYPTKDKIYARYGGGTMQDYNCRHSEFPVNPEMPPKYTQAELRELERQERETIMYNGKPYNKYEQTQKQREFERRMRKYRSKIVGLKEANLDTTTDKMKYRAINQQYKEFSRVCGIKTQMKRVYQDELGRVL